MMCVNSYIDKSGIEGMGVFAGEKIPKGAVIWKFNNLIDKVVKEEDIKSLPEIAQKFVLHYSYKTDGFYVFCGDNGRYMNHSADPNTEGLESEDNYGITVANRDIKKGEEITGDYNSFDEDFESKQRMDKFS